MFIPSPTVLIYEGQTQRTMTLIKSIPCHTRAEADELATKLYKLKSKRDWELQPFGFKVTVIHP